MAHVREPFPEAERRLAELEPDARGESDEVYVVSIEADGTAKFRDGVMDVKRLEQVGEGGLELWKPVAKAEPDSAADASRLLHGLQARPSEPTRPEYTIDEFIADLVEPNPLLRAVPVHKRRTHYTFEGCMTEVTDMQTGAGHHADDRHRGSGIRNACSRRSAPSAWTGAPT